jgi:hypothetical protein
MRQFVYWSCEVYIERHSRVVSEVKNKERGMAVPVRVQRTK